MSVTETDFLRLSRRVKAIEEQPGSGGMSLSEIGAITLWPVSDPPRGWLVCDGSAVSRAEYADLFKKLCCYIGSAYIDVGTPCAITVSGHGFSDGDSVYLTTAGALPAGLTANTLYYVRDADANTLRLSAVKGGAAINTSGSQYGAHNVYACPWGISGADTFNLPDLKEEAAAGHIVLNFIIRYQSYTAPKKGDRGDKGDKGVRGEKGDFAPAVTAGYSADGESWHPCYQEGDDYIRFSVDGGTVWGEAIYIRGREGGQGGQGEQGASYRMLGEYSPETEYVNDNEYVDCVTYNGSSYYAKQNTAGNFPTQTVFWGELARKGLDGSGTGDVIGPVSNIDGYIPLWSGNDCKTLGGGVPQSTFAGASWGTHAHHQELLPPGADAAHDAVSGWADTGFRTILLSANMLLNQPSEQGMLLSFAQGAEVHQIWLQSSGTVYHRSGNAAGWACAWMKIWGEANDGTGSQLDADKLDGYDAEAFLKLAGGVLTGGLKVKTPGGNWITGKTGTYGINCSLSQNTAAFFPVLRQLTSSGHTICLGGLGDEFGFYGYKSNRIENGYDYKFMTMNPQTGVLRAFDNNIWHNGNIQVRTGQCTLNSSNETAVSFASPNLSGIPRVNVTPNTTASSVIAPKVRSASASGFSAIIGGSGFSNVVCDYIAVYLP